jgi:hypothetical protein
MEPVCRWFRRRSGSILLNFASQPSGGRSFPVPGPEDPAERRRTGEARFETRFDHFCSSFEHPPRPFQAQTGEILMRSLPKGLREAAMEMERRYAGRPGDIVQG